MANFLKSLFVKGIEIDTFGASSNQVLTYNGTKFAPATTTASVATLDAIGDVTAPSPSSGDFLKWNGTAWVNDPINLGTDTVGSYVSTVNGASGAITNVAKTTDKLSVFASTTSAELADVISNETGSGSLVFSTSPTLTTPEIASGSYIADVNGDPLITVPLALAPEGGPFPNNVTIANAKTGNTPYILATSGTDTNVSLNIRSKGTGSVQINGKAISLADSFTTSGAFALTLTTTASTNVTLPTSGTLATTSNKLSAFASTSSSELAGVISDETGSGALVFGTSPAFTTSITTGSTTFALLNTTATTINFGGGATTEVNIGNASGIVNINASKLSLNNASGNEGGELFLAKPPNGTLGGGVTIDAYIDRLRFFEQGGTARGFHLNLASGAAGAGTEILYNGFTSPSFVTSITTSSSTFSLVNATATTINFGGAATTINMGATGGTTAITGAVTTTGTITSNGLIKSNGRFDADDSLGFWIARDNDGTVLFRADTTDTVYADVITGRAVIINSAGTMGTATSSIRRKTDVSNYLFDTSAVLGLQPVKFKYKEEYDSEGNQQDWQYGFIAEQAQEIGLTELVELNEDGLPDYFAYERLCVAQQQVIRELWAKVEALETRLG